MFIIIVVVFVVEDDVVVVDSRQLHLTFAKILSTKNFWYKKYFGKKKFGSKKIRLLEQHSIDTYCPVMWNVECWKVIMNESLNL